MVTIITIYALLGTAFAVSLIKSREKTKKALVIAGKALLKTGPTLLAILGLIGLTLGLLPPKTISSLLGEEGGFIATLSAAAIGAITMIPALIAFPLAGSLLRSGATVMTISVFVTTLVMVGVVTAPMEINILGKKFTLLRNGLSFIGAIIIAVLMGLIL